MRIASLKGRITILASVLVGIAWVIAVGGTWLEARHEAEELFDAHLVQAASLLIAQTSGDLDETADDGVGESHAPELHRYARRVAFQVWVDGRLRLHSANAPSRPLSKTRVGLSNSVIEGERWRVFSAWNEKHEALVQVGERAAARDDMARGIAAGLLKPLLIALPLVALLIWFAVLRGMRPLEDLARELERRSPERLEELPSETLPNEVKPLVMRLNSLFRRVTQTFAQERRFTADAAHELRTPLAGLRAQAQVALAATESASRQRALSQVIQGCDRMGHLVEQLLLLARVDAALPNDFAVINLTEVVADAVRQQAPRAAGKGVEMELAVDDSVSLRGNAAWISILVRNLVDNAIRHTPQGGHVRVNVQRDGRQIVLTVVDDGEGVLPEELARLGQRFWRSPESVQSAGDTGGSGLGLSIVARIAELHAGKVEFAQGSDARPGQGLEVRVTFAAHDAR